MPVKSPHIDQGSIMHRYQAEAGRLQKEFNQLHRKYNRISWLRLVLVIVSAISIYFLFKLHLLAGIMAIFLSFGVFLLLVHRHLTIASQKDYIQRLLHVNHIELDYLKGEFSLSGTGSEYLYETHPYATDLDIFGKKSLFHYINRTHTKTGSDKLANALSMSVEESTIRERQKSAEELAPQWQWRQSFLAKSTIQKDDVQDFEQILQWIKSPNTLLERIWLNWARYLIPPITIALCVLVILFLPLSAIIFVFLIPASLLLAFAKDVSHIQKTTEDSYLLLEKYASLIRHIESHSFHSGFLNTLQKQFKGQDGQSASTVIKGLSYYIRQLNVRQNPFAFILNLFGLWDFHWALALEGWKHQHKGNLPNWIEALGEMDFLISLANAADNHPHWTFPEISDSDELKFVQFGHPLIFHKEVVKNDLETQLIGKIRLITGSNMAGKSTFLRAVGVNMVLAYAGFPIYADNASLPIKKVFTSMRTRDNLQESTSSFYAELKRLKAALLMVQKEGDVYLLLDEILKGTNSIDRHTGSKALILQLLGLNCSGLIATHDLDLAVLEEATSGKLENWCFDVEIFNGNLSFDYLIKRGVCSSFNATHLMEKMGFELNQK